MGCGAAPWRVKVPYGKKLQKQAAVPFGRAVLRERTRHRDKTTLLASFATLRATTLRNSVKLPLSSLFTKHLHAIILRARQLHVPKLSRNQDFVRVCLCLKRQFCDEIH